jgi:hypothetical protein
MAQRLARIFGSQVQNCAKPEDFENYAEFTYIRLGEFNRTAVV